MKVLVKVAHDAESHRRLSVFDEGGKLLYEGRCPRSVWYWVFLHYTARTAEGVYEAPFEGHLEGGRLVFDKPVQPLYPAPKEEETDGRDTLSPFTVD